MCQNWPKNANNCFIVNIEPRLKNKPNVKKLIIDLNIVSYRSASLLLFVSKKYFHPLSKSYKKYWCEIQNGENKNKLK